MASASNTGAATYKWLQPYDLENGYDIASNIYGTAGTYQTYHVVADDWKSADDLPVSDFHWWGSYWEKTGNGLVPYTGEQDPYYLTGSSPQFYLRIYEDIPADQNIPYSHPGKLLWERPTAFTGIFVGHEKNPDAGGASKFEWNLSYWEEQKWFKPDKDTTYWFSVYQDLGPNDKYVWGWETSSEHWNDSATYWDGTKWHEVTPTAQTDMAFGLTTVPIPGAIWLLGSGLIGVMGLSRKKSSHL